MVLVPDTEIVVIQDDEAEAPAVEVVVAALEPVGLERLLVRVPVVVVVADSVVGLDVEVVVRPDEGGLVRGAVREVARMDDEVDVRRLGAPQDGAQPLRRVVREDARIVVQIGEGAEFHMLCAHGGAGVGKCVVGTGGQRRGGQRPRLQEVASVHGVLQPPPLGAALHL